MDRQSRVRVWGREILLCDAFMADPGCDMCLSKTRECPTPEGDPTVNYGLGDNDESVWVHGL